MSNGKRRYFPGANTGRGFIGHFEGIVPPWSEPHYTYVLKGGPGVGKSTLMKKCAAIARANGFTVEEFRCASDPESFDAVRIPQRRLVLLDGTAPAHHRPRHAGDRRRNAGSRTVFAQRGLQTPPRRAFCPCRRKPHALQKRVRVPFRRRQPAPCRRKRSRKVCRPYHDPHIFKRGFHTAEGRHTAHTIFNEPHARRRCGFPRSTGCRKHRVLARRFGRGVLK